MSITEYIYIDKRRLDSYLEQIASPIIYDKVPVWRAALGLSPSLEGTVEKHGRELTTHEKITKLMNYLNKENLIYTWRLRDRERWGAPTHGKVFVLETCQATRIWIPPKPHSSLTFKGLTLWISSSPLSEYQSYALDQEYPPEFFRNMFPEYDEDRPVGTLYLLEDFPRDDLGLAQTVSSYTALHMLLYEYMTGARKEGILEEFQNTIVGSALIDPKSITYSDLEARFSSDPTQLLAQLGAKIGTSRTIQTLYRIRATLNDRNSKPEFSVVTIGYPIFIAEADETGGFQ